jgi:Tfp pilus assembly protein PilN
MRLLTSPPADGFLAIHSSENDVEAYGESQARPIFSVELGALSEKAIASSRSELRLPPDAEPYSVEQLLPKPRVFPPNHDPAGPDYARSAFPYATALAGACPWLGLNVNLLPPEQRRSSSRLRLIPTIVLASVLLLMAGALAAYSSYEDGKYLTVLHDEIRKVEPRARKVSVIDRDIIAKRARTQMLDDFRRRSKADMDALNELTRLLPAPGWLNGLEIRRNQVQLSGETEQAAILLKVIDSSPLFESSEFTMAPTRTGNNEVFSIRAHREGAPK